MTRSPSADAPSRPLSRRRLLRSAGLAGTVAAMGVAGGRALATSRPVSLPPGLPEPPICQVADTAPVTIIEGATKHLRLTWNANAICTVGVPVADAKGLFAKRNLKVELINFGGSTDQLLEAIATGKADAGVGMALRWLKPLEQGFDVKITTAIHGGCMRLLAAKGSGITSLEGLKGKRIGATDMGAPDKNFFSIGLAKRGIDPIKDVEWRIFPADMLGVALKKGEIDAFALGDPLGWVIRDRDGLVEVTNNLAGEYAHRACCILGVRGSLIREQRPAAAAVTEALLEAQDWVAANPDEASAIFAPYSAAAKPEQLAAMLRSHTHAHHPTGEALKQELAAYIAELKVVSVIKPRTDPARLSDKVYANVLS